MLRGWIIIISVFICSTRLYSQAFVYSKNYFRWPVANKPGIVANFGELRSGHWHMGLDIRTDQKENMPVYAAAEGYIAKISVGPFGFGKAIYINHPNGLTTVYGHLNKFFSKLDSFVKARQYKQQSWEIELDFTKDKFPVRKGQFIAYSGNTGGSQGPHVHFEIRNSKTGRCMNPLFFNLPVPDRVPPVFSKLALYNRGGSIYEQVPTLFSVKKINNGYIPKNELIKTGFSKLGFAIEAYDYVTGSRNANGIYSARIFFDSRQLIEFAFDSMDYNETDYINSHIDYRYRYNTGLYLQQLFKLPGDHGRAYRPKANDGTIYLNDTAIHSIRIEIGDVKRNTSVMNFKIQFSDSLSSEIKNGPRKAFTPNYVNVFEQNDFELYAKEDCFYDTVQPVFYRLSPSEINAVSSQFQFCNASIPVHDQINIRIKPNVRIPEQWESKIVIKRTDGRNIAYRKAKWEKDPIGTGWLAASFNGFGTYEAFIDSVAPAVNDLSNADTIDLSPSKNIIFYPKDNTGIKNFRAYLDGQWLMFSNDKGVPWVYKFDEKCPYGIHQLKLRIEDIAGNITEKQWWFKRYAYNPPKKGTLPKKKAGGKKQAASGKKKSTKRK